MKNRNKKKSEIGEAVHEVMVSTNKQLDDGKLDHLSSSEILLSVFESLAVAAVLASQGYTADEINKAFTDHGKKQPLTQRIQEAGETPVKKALRRKVDIRKLNKGNKTEH